MYTYRLYMEKNIFLVFKIFFSFFEKSWLRRKMFHALNENTKSSVCPVSLDFPQRLNFLKFFLKWDYISLMKWHFFKRENPDCLQIYRDWQAFVDMIPPILLQRCKFYRSCNRGRRPVSCWNSLLIEHMQCLGKLFHNETSRWLK